MNLGQYLAKILLESEDQKTIALFPGAFKPPTIGHFDCVKKLLQNSDQVVVLVSPKVREGITDEESIRVWNLYKNYIDGDVEIKISSEGSPVKEVYDVVKNNPDTNFIVAFGKGEANRYNNITKYPNVKIFDAGALEGVSATNLRMALINKDHDKIKQYIPNEVTVEEFLNTLEGKIDLPPQTNDELPTEQPLQEFSPISPSEQDNKHDYITQNRHKIEKAAAVFNLPIPDMEHLFTSGREITLSDDVWKELQNSESYKMKTLEDAISHSLKLGINPKPYIEVIKKGKDLPLPLILCYEQNKYYLVGGEVILSLYRALGSIPTIIQGTLKTQSRLNEMDSEQQSKISNWFKDRWKDYSINMLKKELDKAYSKKETKYLIPMIKGLIQSKRDIPIENNQINLKESYNQDYIKLLAELAKYCCENLNIPIPKIKLINNSKFTEQNKTFGQYNPLNNQIYVVIHERVLADAMRSECHEIYHSYQNHNGKLNNKSGDDGSNEENEANIYSGKIMREFGRKYPEIFLMKYMS